MNNIVRSSGPVVGQRDGNWIWNGSNWVCDPDCDGPQPFPPFGPPVFSGPVQQPPWYPGANGGVSFGATFPPNPVRGHLFWDGKTFWLFDGAAWVTVGGVTAAGNVTPPTTTAPANPVPGQQWFNGTTLFVWDGNAWVPVSTTKTTIQATAPPAPNPGDLWFDGTQLHIWDGSAWELVGPGATVGPVPTTTEVFRLGIPAGGIPIAAGAWVIIPFGATPAIDTLAGWDPATHKYTPKKPGMYTFISRGYTGSTATDHGSAILKNDQGTFDLANVVPATMEDQEQATVIGWWMATGLIAMNGTTDFVRTWGYNGTGTYFSTGASPAMQAFLMP
jgi:hypothetical protein